jgi:hypothetical protein
VTSVDTRVNTVSNLVSALTSAHNVLSNAVSAAGLGGVSVTSNELSAVSATFAQSINAVYSDMASSFGTVSNTFSAFNAAVGTALATLSNTVSGVSATALTGNNAVSAQAASALSQAISVLSPRQAVLATTAVVSAAAATTIPGLSVTVSLGGVYQLQAMLLCNRGTSVAQIAGYGLVVPACTHARGRVVATHSLAQGFLASAVFQNHFDLGSTASAASIIVSTTSAAATSVFITFAGIIIPSADGVVHLLGKASAGATAEQSFLPGSHLQVLRIA